MVKRRTRGQVNDMKMFSDDLKANGTPGEAPGKVAVDVAIFKRMTAAAVIFQSQHNEIEILKKQNAEAMRLLRTKQQQNEWLRRALESEQQQGKSLVRLLCDTVESLVLHHPDPPITDDQHRQMYVTIQKLRKIYG